MLTWLLCGLIGYALLVWVRYWQDSNLALIHFISTKDYKALVPGIVLSLVLGPLTILFAAYVRFVEGK